MTADLVAVAHGTADARGRRTVHELVREMGQQRPDVRMSMAFVDVDHPALESVAERVVADGNEAVVVPLLLSTGYHVRVDVRGICARTGAVPAGPLGPDPMLVDVLADRLGPLGGVDRVVLAAAGSSDTRTLLDCELTAALLASWTGRPVDVGYVSGRGRRLGDVLEEPSRTAVATYLLAPGFFADQVRRIAQREGVVTCTEPLGADPRVARLALRRYDEAMSSSGGDRTRLPTVSLQTSTE